MITMCVTYAGTADTPFDRSHWMNVHLPLVRESWGNTGWKAWRGSFPVGMVAALSPLPRASFATRPR